MNFCAKQPHALDIGTLSFDIFSPHKDFALHIEQRTGGGGGDAMLASTGFGNNFGFTHALGQKCLTDNIVDFMRAGMIQLITFEI